MKLWTVEECVDSFTIENDEVSLTFRDHIIAQKICDEHNAWLIMAERGWLVAKWWHKGGYYVTDIYGTELVGYKSNIDDTAVAAILAADNWLQEQGAKQ